MKAMIALFVTMFSVMAAAAPTEVVFYSNYKTTQQSDVKSTVLAPASAEYLLSDVTYGCFNGDASGALEVIKAMIKTEAATGTNIVLESFVQTVDYSLVGNPEILVDVVVKAKVGHTIYTGGFPLLRPCSRKSK